MVKLHLLSFLCVMMVTGCASKPRGLPPVGSILNFDHVDKNVCRGAQPDEAGLRSLKAWGVRTIVNLRMPGDIWTDEEGLARASGFAYFNVPMSGYGRPLPRDVENVLTIIKDSPGPVFIHCQHGCDRTGTIIACYRIQHDRWKTDKALAEARIHGMSPLEIWMKSFVRDFGKLAAARAE